MKYIATFLLGATLAMSAEKLTTAEHRVEAERHRSRAETFAAKAAKHEAAVERLMKPGGYNAMRHKWPGLANGPLERERQLAMQARRAEAESRKLAAHHEARTVEAP